MRKVSSQQATTNSWQLRLKRSRSGQVMIEVLAAIAVTAVVVTSLVGLGVQAMRSAVVARNRTQAVAWAQEGIEAVRSIRDRGYAVFTACGEAFQIGWDGTRWTCTPGTETLGSIFTRRFTATEVAPGARRVVVWVNWRDLAGSHNVSLETYLTNWR